MVCISVLCVCVGGARGRKCRAQRVWVGILFSTERSPLFSKACLPLHRSYQATLYGLNGPAGMTALLYPPPPLIFPLLLPDSVCSSQLPPLSHSIHPPLRFQTAVPICFLAFLSLVRSFPCRSLKVAVWVCHNTYQHLLFLLYYCVATLQLTLLFYQWKGFFSPYPILFSLLFLFFFLLFPTPLYKFFYWSTWQHPLSYWGLHFSLFFRKTVSIRVFVLNAFMYVWQSSLNIFTLHWTKYPESSQAIKFPSLQTITETFQPS